MFQPYSPVPPSPESTRRAETANLVGVLLRTLEDLDLACDIAQEVLSSALQAWGETGIPEQPGAALLGATKTRLETIANSAAALTANEREFEPPVLKRDDVLRLMLVVCPASVPLPARTSLLLRFVGGLTVREIAVAYHVSEREIVERIAEAQRVIAQEGPQLGVPKGAELHDRARIVQHTIHAVFEAGYWGKVAHGWSDAILCDEAMRVGHGLAELTPSDPEIFALLALMELRAARLGAHARFQDEFSFLADHNRDRWDYLMIGRGMSTLDHAERLGGSAGPFALRAAIERCHARARSMKETDWERIVELYEELVRHSRCPDLVPAFAHALTVASGPARGLRRVEELRTRWSLDDHGLFCARAELFSQLGRHKEAKEDFERAAERTDSNSECGVLLARAAQSAALMQKRPHLRLVK